MFCLPPACIDGLDSARQTSALITRGAAAAGSTCLPQENNKKTRIIRVETAAPESAKNLQQTKIFIHRNNKVAVFKTQCKYD